MTEDQKRKRGRPESCGVGVVAAMRQQLLADGKIDKLLDRVYELALSGDPAAIRIILDRVLPSLRSESLPVRVDVDVNASLTAQARAIVRAAVEGRIAPDTASELIKAIASVGAVSELDELRRRVDQLQFGDLA